MKVSTPNPGEESRLGNLAAIGVDAIVSDARQDELDQMRVVVLVLDVPSDEAAIVTGNYDHRGEAVADIALLMKALDD